jgi:hypothetical protein
MAVNRTNGHTKDQRLPLQVPPKFTQIRIFDSENMTSGNPGLVYESSNQFAISSI